MLYVKDMTPPDAIRRLYHAARNECIRLSKDKTRRNRMDRELAAAKAEDLKHYLERLEAQWKTNT